MDKRVQDADKKILLHLSDIHFNKDYSGKTFDLDEDLRNELELDSERMLQKLGAIHGILVTGDIAFAGRKEEYDIASGWLDKLCEKLACPSESVWTIPGNHDIDRTVIDGSRTLQMYRTSLRNCNLGNIDTEITQMMKDEIARKAIFSPIENYNKFATQYGCNIDADNPTWHQNILLNDGSQIRILGLNSVLVSDRYDDTEKNKLILGTMQSLPKRIAGVEYMVLCHHPLDWLRDYDQVHANFTARACIQLFGHKHSQRIDQIGNTIRMTAGAVHPERNDTGWKPRYNVIALKIEFKDGNRYLAVDVYPRVWNDESTSFVADFDNYGLDRRTFLLQLSNWVSLKKEAISVDNNSTVSTEEGVFPLRPAEIITDNPEELLDLGDQVTLSSVVMNKARRLTYRYMTLPFLERLKIAQELELLRDEDEGMDETYLLPLIFQRAKEGNKLAQLWDEVESAHRDFLHTENPFKNV